MGDQNVMDSMIHPQPERLEAFVEESLDTGERAIVESHLVECVRCQAEVEEVRNLFLALASLPRFSPSADFAKRIMAHVKLPDPWWARAGQFAISLAPRTTRGWAFASGMLGLPVVMVTVLATWLLSKPYVTGESLIAFAWTKSSTAVSATFSSVFSAVLQSEIMLMVARGIETVYNAGFKGAGAAVLLLAAVTVLSAWVLYENLFRTTTTRRSEYASFSF